MAVWGVWTSTKHLFEMGLVFLREKKKNKRTRRRGRESVELLVLGRGHHPAAIQALQGHRPWCPWMAGAAQCCIPSRGQSCAEGRCCSGCGFTDSQLVAHLPVAGSTQQPLARNSSATAVGHGVSRGGSAVPRCPCPDPLCAVGRDGHSTHCRRAEHPAVLPVEQEHFQHLRRVFAVPAIPVCAGHNVDPYVKALEEQRAEGAVGAEGLLSKLHTLGGGGGWGFPLLVFALEINFCYKKSSGSAFYTSSFKNKAVKNSSPVPANRKCSFGEDFASFLGGIIRLLLKYRGCRHELID